MTNTRTIGDAIAIATNWIVASDLPFSSAFIGGSAAYAEPGSPHNPASDIDCYLVVDADPPDGKIGKLTVDGVLLDVSWMPWSTLEQGDTDAVIASLLNFGRVVKDDGKLGLLQTRIQDEFITSNAITNRWESMRAKIHDGLAVDSSHLPQSEQVMNWLFPATLVTHIPLVISCSPLTVRKRFIATRNVMEPANYERLLSLFTFDTVTRRQAQAWLDAATRLFDATTGIAEQSTRFWASDIQASARQVAIGGSQELIDAGDHREAMFWIIATSARCLTVRHDAGFASVKYLLDFWKMLHELYMESAELRQMKTEAILKWTG